MLTLSVEEIHTLHHRCLPSECALPAAAELGRTAQDWVYLAAAVSCGTLGKPSTVNAGKQLLQMRPHQTAACAVGPCLAVAVRRALRVFLS